MKPEEDHDDLDAFLDLDEYMENTEAAGSKRTPGPAISASFETDQATYQREGAKVKNKPFPERVPLSPVAKTLNVVFDGQPTGSRNGSNLVSSERVQAPSHQPSGNCSPQPAITSEAKAREPDEEMIALNNADAEGEGGGDFLDDLDKWLEDSVVVEQ